MASGVFLDSNVLLYAYTEDPRSEIAQKISSEPYCISVQVLNEFANVAFRKLKREWDEIDVGLTTVMRLAEEIVPVTLELHLIGKRIAQRYGIQVYDGVIVAAALESSCHTLFSEDMQHGLIIEDRLRIVNPFV